MADEPCSAWATVDDIAGCASCSTEGINPACLEEALWVASAWLYRLDGRRYPGACSATIRPIAECGCCGTASLPWGVSGWILIDSRSGRYVAVRGSAGLRGRPREGVEEVALGYAPIREIVEVLIDGVALDPAAYRIDDDSWLVRLDGQPWPHTNTMELATTEVGTWSVELVYGADPPRDAMVAARTWALEIAKGLSGGDCALPARATQMVRQGVSLTLLDPTDLLEDGRTGIPTVDAYLATSNPSRLEQSSVFVNPDQMRLSRRTTPFVGS